jgi:xanthine dehydrogenase YagS FAD-binding subunit
MKTFTHSPARTPQQAAQLSRDAHAAGKAAAFAAGGSDLLGLVKERIIAPDVIIGLRGLQAAATIAASAASTTIGAQATLTAISSHEALLRRHPVLAEAAGSVATAQVRNVATLGGNLAQRPWCWYYRNGFNCYKAGGNQCFSFAGENQFHAIFGGGPSYIVHPSDTAPALVALDATFRIVGPGGQRDVKAADFFVLPRQNARGENVLGADDLIVSVSMPSGPATQRSTYRKVLDREAWTHAVISAAVVMDIDGGVCRSARVVLGGVAPIPWRLPEVERLLAGQRITAELAAKAGEQAIVGARPLSKNAYKVPMTKAIVRDTIMELGAGVRG